MLEPNEKFDVPYRGNLKVTCVCLAGRKFGRLMSILSRLQNSGEKIDDDLFENAIPEALGLCFGSQEIADKLWDDSLTLRDAIEILTNAVQKHIVSGEDVGK